jgi:hypothetical protein
MKSLFYILFLLIFVSCDLIPDLERDNPLDANNDSNLSAEKTILEIKDVYVTSRPNSNTGGVVNQNIQAGDEVYIGIDVINKGQFDAERQKLIKSLANEKVQAYLSHHFDIVANTQERYQPF